MIPEPATARVRRKSRGPLTTDSILQANDAPRLRREGTGP